LEKSGTATIAHQKMRIGDQTLTPHFNLRFAEPEQVRASKRQSDLLSLPYNALSAQTYISSFWRTPLGSLLSLSAHVMEYPPQKLLTFDFSVYRKAALGLRHRRTTHPARHHQLQALPVTTLTRVESKSQLTDKTPATDRTLVIDRTLATGKTLVTDSKHNTAHSSPHHLCRTQPCPHRLRPRARARQRITDHLPRTNPRPRR
jgi:hypothetical protein